MGAGSCQDAAIDPDGGFPDGGVPLDPVNQKLASRERLLPMGRPYTYQHGNVPDIDTSDPMSNQHAVESPVLLCLLDQLIDNAFSHRFIGFVDEMRDRMTLLLTTHHAEELR